ncbi:hypothetical protein ARMGADRAFT_1061633 [Armillaria gallica]|uniref:F-box domain-containing protein n=1 Tax=Armillaria gallica TaxID=47427 RepID=A0A2H3E5G8_ARMGA|nr:hypothetical protein ARMGADRAFT_1061633 [Armillaria gallica]
MSCLTCSNCGFINSLSPEPQLQTLKGSDNLVSQILRGSRPLLESDHIPINDDIAKLEQLWSWYDAQLQNTQRHWRTILNCLENRKSVYAPICRLPRDILLEIFHSTCDSFEGDSLDMAGPLWVLGSVCALWRDILHTSAASWARYVLVKSPFSKHAPEILQAYLERTGEYPLSLVVICDGANLAEDGEIMSLLVQSCYQWRDVYIHINMHHAHHLDSVSRLPGLQTIQIDIFNDDDGDDYHSDMCLNAPLLWQAVLPSQGIHQVRLPDGITHYSGFITSAEDLQLLSQLPKLRTCHLLPSELSSTAAPVLMAELRQLYIEDLDTLDLLTAPVLQSLTIAEVPRRSLSSISLFFRRSECRLESLSMCAEGSPTLISSVFSSEACSMISYLKLELGPNWDDISRKLAPSSILPNLRLLVFCFDCRYNHLMQSERLAFLDMIQSRCKTGLLKMIEVQFGWGTSILCDIEADIRAVIGDNAEIRVGEWSPLDLDYRLSFSGPGSMHFILMQLSTVPSYRTLLSASAMLVIRVIRVFDNMDVGEARPAKSAYKPVAGTFVFLEGNELMEHTVGV